MRNKNKITAGILSAAFLCCSFFSEGFAQQSSLKPVKKTAITKKVAIAATSGSATGILPTDSKPPKFNVCATDALMQTYILENNLQALYAQELINKQNTIASQESDRAVKIVPVVFHIVYPNNTNGTAMNTKITTAVVNSVIARLNADYAKTSTSDVRSSFQSLVANTNIQFCLATKDASGNATTGIIRKSTTVTYFDSNSSSSTNGANAMKAATNGSAGWDHLKYVNIWLCDITNNMALCSSGCTAGYSYLGTTSQGGLPPQSMDGIVLDYNIGLFEYPGTSNLTISKAVSHEAGHYFGLDHTFVNNTSCSGTGDDGFSDTPRILGPFQNSYSSCSSASTVQSCTAGKLWQYENLMDYSDCFTMFTPLQSAYMNNVLTNGRYGLVASQTTACASGAAVIPVAAFNGCNSSVAKNSVVTFTDASTNTPTSWLWAITPATGVSYVNSTSTTSQNPQVTFANAGTYSVSLTATNSAGSNTTTSSTCITVVAGAVTGCDTLSNYVAGDTLSAFYVGTNWGYYPGTTDYNLSYAEKFTPTNLGTMSSFYVLIYQANQKSTSGTVAFKVYGNGTLPAGTALATKNVAYSALNSSAYNNISLTSPLNITSNFFISMELAAVGTNSATQDTVIFGLNFNGANSGRVNTAYIKYSGTWSPANTLLSSLGSQSYEVLPVICPVGVSVAEVEANGNMLMFPNPSNGVVSVLLSYEKEHNIRINVYNTLGQVVYATSANKSIGGKFDMDLSNNKNGIYFVEVKSETGVTTQRLILNR